MNAVHRCKGTRWFFSVAVGLLLPLLGASDGRAASETFCHAYADLAVQQRNSALERNLPGIEGPQWSADRNLHFEWCLRVSQAIANGETVQRDQHLGTSKGLIMYNDMREVGDYRAATVYSRIHYAGASMALQEGSYDVDQLTVGDNAVRSLEVTPGYQVVLLPHAHFLGEAVTVTQDVTDLNALGFAGATSSIVVRRHDPIETPGWGTRVAAFFDHPSYQGHSFALPIGHHDMPVLQTDRGNDVISSLKVLPGYRVIVFQHDRFRGISQEIRRDWPDLGTLGLDDQVSSIVIEEEAGAYDLAAVSWCYELSAFGHEITFFPMVKNVGSKRFWARNGRKYDMTLVTNATRSQATFTIPASFVLQPGQVNRLPQGIKSPIGGEARNWNFGFVGHTILHADPDDLDARNDRFHALLNNKPITGSQLLETWDHHSCTRKQVGRTWKLELDELVVETGDDEDPYFIVIGFRSQFGVPGSTRTFTNQFQNSDWASDVSSGDRRSLPEPMATLYFQDLPVEAGLTDHLELIGAVVVAMEADMSSWSAVENIAKQTMGQLRQELEALWEQQDFILLPRKERERLDQEQMIEESLERIFDAMDPSASDVLGEVFTFRWNMDDFIDYNALIFLASQPLGSVGIPRFGKGRAGFLSRQVFDHARPLRFVHWVQGPMIPEPFIDVDFRVTGKFEPIW